MVEMGLGTEFGVSRWSSGDAAVRGRVLDLLYRDLDSAAASLLRRESQVSLSSGDLVHECVLRLMRLRETAIESRSHFLSLASRLMRRILIDHVRAKRTDKRDHERVTLITRVEPGRAFDLLELDEALTRLRTVDAERSEIVEMRYFGGMSTADIADVLSLSEATVKRRWTSARAWLFDAMTNLHAAAQPGA